MIQTCPNLLILRSLVYQSCKGGGTIDRIKEAVDKAVQIFGGKSKRANLKEREKRASSDVGSAEDPAGISNKVIIK